MRAMLLALTLIASAVPTLAQPPGRPPLTISGPDLGYRPLAQAEAFSLPDGVAFASVASVEFAPNGNLMVLHRGDQPFLEFDSEGQLVRSFGEGLFARSHGLRFDRDGNMWVTDVGSHIVMKLGPDGEVLLTLGTRGVRGVWNEPAGTERFDEPNDIAFSSNGDVFISQGHLRGEPRILKFDSEGNFLKMWGSRGTGPGQFAAAHSLVIDDRDRVLVADRENQRIQVFDTDGNRLEQWKYDAMACALYLGSDGFLYMTSGFDAQILKLDLNGNVLGVTGSSGDGPNQYGEAHFLAVGPDQAIYVADVVNRRVEKLVPR
jgi:DNA-binding beta-propeller fold protein YncE